MLQKIIILIIILVVVIAGWYYWQDSQNSGVNPAEVVTIEALPELQAGDGRYVNKFYGLALDYPENWYLGHEGESLEMATSFWLVSHLPEEGSEEIVGVRVDFVVYDIAQAASKEEYFPPVSSAADWVVWERSGEQNTTSTPTYVEEEMELSGSLAVQTVYQDPAEKVITVLGPYSNYVYRLTLSGSQVDYDNNLAEFNDILESFHWVK